MRLRNVVVKPTAGRLWLHHLRSTYSVEINAAALSLIQDALDDPGSGGAGRAMLQRLASRGLADDGAPEPLVTRDQSDLVSIEVEPMGRCNLACAHCFVQFSQKRMIPAIFEQVLEGARALGAVELTFNGGEPLLHPRALDWIEQAARSDLRVLLFTNGTLVTERTAARLSAAQVAQVTVSLDGFEKTHDALRGEGAFRRTVRGIRRLVAEGLAVHTTTMVHPDNAGELEALKRFCREELGVAGVRVSTIAAIGRAEHRGDLQLPSDSFAEVYRDAPLESATATASRLLPCRAGVDKVFVNASGAVHACHLFDGVSPPLGTLTMRSLEDVVRAPSPEISRLLRDFDPADLVQCQSCPELKACRGGCRARAWQMSGDPLGVDPTACRRRKVTMQESA